MKRCTVLVLAGLAFITFAADAGESEGLRGDPAAIARAEAMVDAMGGSEIWAQLQSLRFVHRWYPWHRVDSYVETETLDLTGPRSRAERRSEVYHQIRSYSPEGKHWTAVNGAFSYSPEEVFKSSMARAPFNFYRLVKAVATGDPSYEVRFGESDIPGAKQIEFYGRDGVLRGWVILNARNEPLVKATPQYRYTLGPLRQFGNLRVPAWGVYDNGATMFEMLSLEGSNQAPELVLFMPPAR